MRAATLTPRHRPDARRRGRSTAAGQHADAARALFADELRARRSVPGPGAGPERQRPAEDLRRDEPERLVEPLRVRRRPGSPGSLHEWDLQITTTGGPPPPPPPPPRPRRLHRLHYPHRRHRLRRHRLRRLSHLLSATSTATPSRSVRRAEGDRPDASQGAHADPRETLLCRSHPPCSLQAGGPRDRPEPEAGQEARARHQGEPGARPQIKHSGSRGGSKSGSETRRGQAERPSPMRGTNRPVQAGKVQIGRDGPRPARGDLKSGVPPGACGFESRPRH